MKSFEDDKGQRNIRVWHERKWSKRKSIIQIISFVFFKGSVTQNQEEMILTGQRILMFYFDVECIYVFHHDLEIRQVKVCIIF